MRFFSAVTDERRRRNNRFVFNVQSRLGKDIVCVPQVPNRPNSTPDLQLLDGEKF